MDEERDPEASYRRGYAHGAEEVFRAVAPALPEDVSAKIKRWLKGDLAAWRQFAGTRFDSPVHAAFRSELDQGECRGTILLVAAAPPNARQTADQLAARTL